MGREKQKNGILSEHVEDFYNECKINLGLNIIGLMCLPPYNDNSSKYFLQVYNLSKLLNLKELSMGMSQDYLEGVGNHSTFLRIGSKIFGERD